MTGHWPLRTQLGAVLVFLALYLAGTGAAFYIQGQARSELDKSLDHDVAVLNDLPRLRDSLRALDAATDEYLLTGDPRDIDLRQQALREVRLTEADLGTLAQGPDRALLTSMDEALTRYLGEQSQWLERKGAGRLPPPDAAKVAARRRPLNAIIEDEVSVKNASLQDLDRRRRALAQASRTDALVLLGTGLLAGLLLVYTLTVYVILPVTDLERRASAWELGREWTYKPAHASPEVRSLARCVRDMTGRLNAQFEREAELSRFKTQLVAVVSHEFNNALNVIQGVSMLLENGETKAPSGRRAECYHMLKANVRMLAMASTNLLNMGRLDSGRFALDARRADIGTLLKDCMDRLAILYQEKGLKVALDIRAERVSVRADPEALTLVLTNLLSNAIKYTPEGGQVTAGVETRPDSPGRARVFVRDTGIGIAPEERERIFTGFYRTEEGKAVARGFGVGLSLARKILEAHGTELELDSEPGKGSTFFFSLPLWR